MNVSQAQSPSNIPPANRLPVQPVYHNQPHQQQHQHIPPLMQLASPQQHHNGGGSLQQGQNRPQLFHPRNQNYQRNGQRQMKKPTRKSQQQAVSVPPGYIHVSVLKELFGENCLDGAPLDHSPSRASSGTRNISPGRETLPRHQQYVRRSDRSGSPQGASSSSSTQKKLIEHLLEYMGKTDIVKVTADQLRHHLNDDCQLCNVMKNGTMLHLSSESAKNGACVDVAPVVGEEISNAVDQATPPTSDVMPITAANENKTGGQKDESKDVAKEEEQNEPVIEKNGEENGENPGKQELGELKNNPQGNDSNDLGGEGNEEEHNDDETNEEDEEEVEDEEDMEDEDDEDEDEEAVPENIQADAAEAKKEGSDMSDQNVMQPESHEVEMHVESELQENGPVEQSVAAVVQKSASGEPSTEDAVTEESSEKPLTVQNGTAEDTLHVIDEETAVQIQEEGEVALPQDRPARRGWETLNSYIPPTMAVAFDEPAQPQPVWKNKKEKFKKVRKEDVGNFTNFQLV